MKAHARVVVIGGGINDCSVLYHLAKRGSIRLATTRDRMDEYRHILAKDHALGIECYPAGPEEARKLFPFMVTDGLVGAMVHVHDGHCDPVGTTNALAVGAKQLGAEIVRFNRVTDLAKTSGGEWRVQTEKGDITCEIVVNAAGL